MDMTKRGTGITIGTCHCVAHDLILDKVAHRMVVDHNTPLQPVAHDVGAHKRVRTSSNLDARLLVLVNIIAHNCALGVFFHPKAPLLSIEQFVLLKSRRARATTRYTGIAVARNRIVSIHTRAGTGAEDAKTMIVVDVAPRDVGGRHFHYLDAVTGATHQFAAHNRGC